MKFTLILIIALVCGGCLESQRQYGLSVDADGVLVKDGLPYFGIGVNYFDAFFRTLKNPSDTTYREGFEELAKYEIPFARFMASGFWPSDYKLYTEDKERYFELLDAVVKCAEDNNVGLIPVFFWHVITVPTLLDEPIDQWGNVESKTHAFMRQYTKELVTRYKDSPAIWGWEFGNEYNLRADLPGTANFGPYAGDVAKYSSQQNNVTGQAIQTAFRQFAREVRKYDSYRIINNGSSRTRAASWNQRHLKTWDQDTQEQYAESMLADNPDPIDVISIHLYWNFLERFGRVVEPSELVALTMEIANKANKPLFIGEFGGGELETADDGSQGSSALAKERFYKMLEIIEQQRVPLSALWVYDFNSFEQTWNVTGTNYRAYQLKAVSQAHKRMQEK